MVKLVGIVNVTPDSFSDGGVNASPEAAVAAAIRLMGEGAQIVDIGAESTRPGATAITATEEWQRLTPVLSAMPKHVAFSIDTRHAETAKKAVIAGAQWINDVSGFSDASMIDTVKSSNCKLVVMHSLSVPADKNTVLPEHADAVEEVFRFGKERLAALEKAGIARQRLIFDPGIGFGKTAQQSLKLIEHIARFKLLAVPILVGHSRKSFLTQLDKDRDAATLRVSQFLAEQGVDYLRVHDVLKHKHILGLQKALA